MEAIKEFLGKNGFEIGENGVMSNSKCNVSIINNSYCILAYGNEFSEYGYDGCMYSYDLNIYWLIGVLTYYNLIDKNYNQ